MGQFAWENLAEYLRFSIAPQAEKLDQDPLALGRALDGLSDRHLLALRVPENLGGSGLSTVEYYQATVAMAAASGTLAFLQTQHQSAASRIAQFGNSEQQRLLPQMARGDVRIGVGFSHLRRRGEPAVQAMPQGDRYCLTGTIPWVTGYGFFQRAIAGATLPDGSEWYGLIPLETCQQSEQGEIFCSQPLPLAAMGVSQTVTVKLQNWLVPATDVLVIQPPGTIHKGDHQQVLHHGFFALGCARGVLDWLATAEFDDLAALEDHWQVLHDQLFRAIEEPQTESFQTQLALRLSVIQTAQTFAQIALTWSGGAGNLLTSPAQRFYREAMMYSIFGQTQAIRAAMVKSLLPGKSSGYTVISNYAGVVQW
ncbi:MULTISPECIES: acyl-CoA dehydrogenase family protein [Cyanophyceae]|uniref:acyl-CoA dehydrogenase family protein n=1 Tax=Cyanophyceae TaxID=3028117 RepID=UPI00016DCA3F|nr:MULTISPECIES: acyl-CoA dehydrogenase family protein [Cyanophyceae]ACB00218.1 acyl-CoA dehydrogenase family protein [Picosynechococcus sp. PCC 7002]